MRISKGRERGVRALTIPNLYNTLYCILCTKTAFSAKVFQTVRERERERERERQEVCAIHKILSSTAYTFVKSIYIGFIFCLVFIISES